MPLLKRKSLQKAAEPMKDSDEVFVCKTTGEIFAKYDDFFNRTMLLSSTVWSCAMTGRTNLTYSGALESEKSAKRTLKTFPAALKGPILLIASRTKRTAINDLASDVHGYAKDVFFKGEIVYTKTGVPETVRKAKIVRVVISDSPSDHIPSRLIYHVESYDEGTPANYSVRGESIIRERNSLSREKCKLFLKQHVELGPNQMWCIKKVSLEQFVTSTGCTDEKVFYGQKPDFEVSKKLQAQKHSHKNAKEIANKKIGSQKCAKSKSEKIDSIDNNNKQKVSSNKKQQSIAKYLKQPGSDSAGKRETIIEKKKDRLEERAKQKILAKEIKLAERALLLPQVALAQKEYSALKEDLELTDQRIIPPAREVRSLIGEENFPDFLFILEFLNTFDDLLSIETKFPDGVTIELLEQALLLREIDGPLSDILQLLLSTIFDALKDLLTSEEANLETGTKNVVKWCYKHFSTNLTGLPMDSTTVSELLRLHIIAYNQPTYYGDACYILIRDHPHILQALTTHTVFQLPVKNVMQIICALIHQLLVTDEFLERVEKIGEARIKFKNNQLEQRRLPRKTAALMQAAQDSMKKELAFHEGQMLDNELDECRKKLEQKLNNELEQIETDACYKMKELQNELEILKQNYKFYQVHLGSDRGFRNYWQFQSLPGLFVEHDTNSIGRCLERVTRNIPGLAQCQLKMRKRYIAVSILKCAGNSNELLEKDDDVYEQLLSRGSSLLEHSKALKKQNVLLDKLNAENACSLRQNGATSSKKETAKEDNIPLTNPTNRELFMCTGDEENCPVHTSNFKNIAKWGFYATRQELDALIKSLNQRGHREQSLREALILYRDSIASRMEKCPIANLSIDKNDHPMTPTSMIESQQKTTISDMPQSDLLETMFRENLLELETRITLGCLGELKVNSIEKWRDAILQRSYDSQTKQLQWGANRCKKMFHYVKKPNQESSSEESEEERVDVFELCKKDPGYDLPTNASTQNEDAPHASQVLQDTVRSMASALLQVEQSIDIKFFRHPFGPKGICKDPNTIMYWHYYGQKKILRWEASLMRATSFSQLFVHYHVLYDAIRWSRSIERAVCMVCRLKGDASVTLLCDECNRACHMYCLKPKLKKIPEGDWFCMRCRPQDHETKPSAKGRKRTEIIDYDELSVDGDDSQIDDNVGGNGNGNESMYDESEDKTSSCDEEYESDKNDEDDDSMIEAEETKAKNVIHDNSGMKTVHSSPSAPRKTQTRGTGITQNQSLQRHPPAKRVHLKETKKEGPAKKRKPSENINLSSAGRRSLDTELNKINTSRSAARTSRNQGKKTIQNQTLQRNSVSKRVRQTESKCEKYTKSGKTSENINIPSTERRSLRLSTKEGFSSS